MTHPFHTNDEFCGILRCSPTTLWRLRRTIPGFPQPFRIGRRLLWSHDQVVQAISLIC